MQTLNECAIGIAPRVPWNTGKLLGAKPPLQSKQVWAIRTKPHIDHRFRNLALFNLTIDSKLTGCSLVSLRVDDIVPNGFAMTRATVSQRKAGHPVKFELQNRHERRSMPI